MQTFGLRVFWLGARGTWGVAQLDVCFNAWTLHCHKRRVRGIREFVKPAKLTASHVSCSSWLLLPSPATRIDLQPLQRRRNASPFWLICIQVRLRGCLSARLRHLNPSSPREWKKMSLKVPYLSLSAIMSHSPPNFLFSLGMPRNFQYQSLGQPDRTAGDHGRHILGPWQPPPDH